MRDLVTAKFKVSRVTLMGADNLEEAWGAEVELTPDYAQGANSEWSEATPSAVCRMTITNKSAVEQFPEGASVTATFEIDSN